MNKFVRKLRNDELDRKTPAEFKKSFKTPIVVVLDNVRSLNNIGSIFRTSDAFLIEAIYLCGITSSPPHREIQKTALGATKTVEWKYFITTIEAIEELKKDGYNVIGIEQTENSIPLHQYLPDIMKKQAVVFGNEVNGIEQGIINICDVCVDIPQYGTKHSFNIAVSTGIVLWDLFWKAKKIDV